MQLVVCSDIHDNIWALERLLEHIPQKDAALLFCGDFCAPFTLVQLAEGFSGSVHIIWGNNDGDQWLLTDQASRFSHVTIHGALAELELAGRSIRANHYPAIARRLAEAGGADLVCYGHDHIAHREKLDNGTLLVNPGEVMGRLGPSTYALIDLNRMENELVTV